MSGSCLDHCEACPVPAGLPCYCDPGMCRRAGQPGQETFRARLVRHAEARAAGPAEPLPAAEALALIARMKACPHWSPRSDCGCGVNACGAGKGRDGLVTHADCFACLKAG